MVEDKPPEIRPEALKHAKIECDFFKYGAWWAPCDGTTVDKGAHHFIEGGLQRERLAAALKWVKVWDVAIDAGAHIGTITAPLAHRFGYVHAFEPVPFTNMALTFNMKPYDNVSVWMAACGAEFGRCRMAFDYSSSLGSFIDSHDGCVPVVPLDILANEPVGLLKIDVEGYEERVLAGATQLLQKAHPVVLVEWKHTFRSELRFKATGVEARKVRLDYGLDAAHEWLDRAGLRHVETVEDDRIYAY